MPLGPCQERRELVREALLVPADEPAREALLVPADEPAREALLVPADEPARRRRVLAGAAFFPSDTGTLVIVLRPAPPVD